MAEDYTIELLETMRLKRMDDVYMDCWGADRAHSIVNNAIGQDYRYHRYYIYRGYVKFPLSDIPEGRVVSAAVLTLYIYRAYVASEGVAQFNLTVVDYTENEDDIYETYSDFGSASMGTLTITDDMETATTYDITLNTTALTKLNEALAAGDEYVYFGLRSDLDITAIAPTAGDYIDFSYARTRGTVLTLTTANWPEDRYPDVPLFPDAGLMDIETYEVIKSYIEDLTNFISEVVYGDDIYFNSYSGSRIYWDGTDEEITRNQVAEDFEVTSLAAGSSISVCGSATVNALTNTTLTTTGNAAITGDLSIPSAAYASIKEQIEHDNLWWEATDGTPSVAATKAKIYQELSTGDLKIIINSGGNTKTAILADFSGM